MYCLMLFSLYVMASLETHAVYSEDDLSDLQNDFPVGILRFFPPQQDW